MHELSIATALARAAIDTAQAHGATRVLALRLKVGAFTDLDPEALRFGWEVIAGEERLLAGAELHIERVPAQVCCAACGYEGPARPPGVCCAACGSDCTRLLAGEELDLAEVELDVPEGGGGAEGPVGQ
ncbi:MAG: hydrogenase maturation nickel metallochaperone HypA [Symbiobacterium sp.]|uniref:hydrogenase maturation nickel metallochaperone HypA n=1 Tax=Symbiobacterium sp. TaxID=1971213 RepID=UPI003464E239